MQSVFTHYLGPTNHRGSRIKAETSAKSFSMTLSWDYALNADANHDRAAQALIAKMNWAGDWVRGSASDENGNVYVNLLHNPVAFTTVETPPAR